MIKFVPTYLNFQYLNGDSTSFDEDAKFVFVLMPFGRIDNEKKKFGDVFLAIQRVVEKACFHGGVLSCSRADLEDDLIIMDSVCQKIKRAGLTIFDISVPNPNVYYELGLASALDKKILLIYNPTLHYESCPEERIPFDINQFRYVEYHSISELKSKLKQKVEALIKLEDFTRVDLQKVYQKVQKITRHLNLDTKAEQIIEDWEISEYEIERACDALDSYFNDLALEERRYLGIKYSEVEHKIRISIGTRDYSKVKEILRAIYWSGRYQPLIANLESLPSELNDVKRDFDRHENEERSAE